MRTILKFRWLVLAVWLIATVGLMVTARYEQRGRLMFQMGTPRP
ncbi:hypothetical protein PTQ21_22385 [Paenibacillus marchantiae]|nr:hypothetical protein [Paenibacillus marchantiae]WDQ31143.1 hypothetical protein PTQ21_22385 [Paenibacillus marchantiae]